MEQQILHPSVMLSLAVQHYKGTPLVSGNRVSLKRAKCSVCESYFTANMPTEFKNRPKYSHTAKSAIAIQHYYAGQPFKRIESLQKAQGVPLADATQYDLMDAWYNTVVMMSVLHTAMTADINPFDYLNTLQLYSDDVQANPDQWLPWNYQDTLYSLTTSKAA